VARDAGPGGPTRPQQALPALRRQAVEPSEASDAFFSTCLSFLVLGVVLPGVSFLYQKARSPAG